MLFRRPAPVAPTGDAVAVDDRAQLSVGVFNGSRGGQLIFLHIFSAPNVLDCSYQLFYEPNAFARNTVRHELFCLLIDLSPLCAISVQAVALDGICAPSVSCATLETRCKISRLNSAINYEYKGGGELTICSLYRRREVDGQLEIFCPRDQRVWRLHFDVFASACRDFATSYVDFRRRQQAGSDESNCAVDAGRLPLPALWPDYTYTSQGVDEFIHFCYLNHLSKPAESFSVELFLELFALADFYQLSLLREQSLLALEALIVGRAVREICLERTFALARQLSLICRELSAPLLFSFAPLLLTLRAVTPKELSPPPSGENVNEEETKEAQCIIRREMPELYEFVAHLAFLSPVLDPT